MYANNVCSYYVIYFQQQGEKWMDALYKIGQDEAKSMRCANV